MTREFVAAPDESQVSRLGGKVLARVSLDKSDIIFADIGLEYAACQRTARMSRRRPDCYCLLTTPINEFRRITNEII